MLNKEDIEKIIPQRDPFLMIDEVEGYVPGESCIAYKYVREDEYYFKGHFPGNPIMPGVLMVEALAQTGAVAILSMEENKGRNALFGGINNLKFKKQVVPGDVLKLEVKMSQEICRNLFNTKFDKTMRQIWTVPIVSKRWRKIWEQKK